MEEKAHTTATLNDDRIWQREAIDTNHKLTLLMVSTLMRA
jgi:hypothetical protein